jgi:hypothetical protein
LAFAAGAVAAAEGVGACPPTEAIAATDMIESLGFKERRKPGPELVKKE